MSTLRQKKVAKAVVESLSQEKPTAQKVLESAGYGTSLQNHPKRVLESQGVREELISLGFNSEAAKLVVAEILIAGENDSVKLKAADMIFKVNSDYAPEKHVNVNYDVLENKEAIEAAEKAYIQHLDGTPEPTQSP